MRDKFHLHIFSAKFWRVVWALLCVSGVLSACQPAIPTEALAGAKAGSAKRIASYPIYNGSYILPQNSRLYWVKVELEDGTPEYRIYLSIDALDYYLGALSHQFPDAPFVSMLFSIGQERYMIGRIDDSLAGKLDSIGFEHPTDDPSHWMQATKVSLLHQDRIFLIPITETEAPEWDSLVKIYIHTRESLKQTVNQPLIEPSIYAWSIEFAQPYAIGDFYLPVAYP